MRGDIVQLFGRPVMRTLLAGLVIMSGVAACSRPSAETDRAVATNARPTPGVVIDRSGATRLPDPVLPTAEPTFAIDRAAKAPALTVTDQLGGEVRLLGGVDEDLLAGVGPRIVRFGSPQWDGTTEAISASPVLLGMPTNLAVFGHHAVVGTAHGLVVLDLDTKPMAVLGSFPLDPVFSVAMHGDTALALVGGYYERGGRMVVLDVSKPTAPRIVRTVGFPGVVSDINVFGDTAFVRDQDGQLVVLDLAESSGPTVLRSGPWPWMRARSPLTITDLEVTDAYLLVVVGRGSMAVNRHCLFVFSLADDASPTLVHTDTCLHEVRDADDVVSNEGVQWAHIVGNTVFVRRGGRMDAVRIGDPAARTSVDEAFDLRQGFYALASTTATRVGRDLIVAPRGDSVYDGRLEALRIKASCCQPYPGPPALETEMLDLKVRSARSYLSVAAEGETVAAITRSEYGFESGLDWLSMGAGGELERVAQLFLHGPEMERLVLRGDTLFSIRGLNLDVFSLANPAQPFRRIGVLEPGVPPCPEGTDETDGAGLGAQPLCGRGWPLSAETLGSLLVTYPADDGGYHRIMEPKDRAARFGPVVYDISDPRRPELLGAAPGDRLVASTFTDGRPLPRQIPLSFRSAAAVAWHDGRAYLAFAGCDDPAGQCGETDFGMLEVRDPSVGLDAPPIAQLHLPISKALMTKFEVDGVPYLLVGRSIPRPGLYVVSIAEPDAPRLVGFVPLPVAPVDLAAAGSHVYVAAEWAGLIVLSAAQSASD
jgi:hypothetical protein